jgi:hypothetical protein
MASMFSLRRVASSVILACVLASSPGDDWSSTLTLAKSPKSFAEVTFGVEALAPVAAGMLKCLNGLRVGLVHSYEELVLASRSARSISEKGARGDKAELPRYTGAGESSIHIAIREANRLLQEGQFRPALSIVILLKYDLERAQATGKIEPLMDNWNARYPADLLVDILLDEIPKFQRTLDEIYRRLKATVLNSGEPLSEDDDTFVERIRHQVQRDLLAAADESGYETLDEMQIDYFDAENIRTSFAVEISEHLRTAVGHQPMVEVVVQGIPTLGRLADALKKQYPALRYLPWTLRLDLEMESSNPIIFPGQKIRLVPASGPSHCFGLGNGSIWGIPLLILAASSGFPWVDLSVHVVTLALTAWGVWADPAFVEFGSLSSRSFLPSA